MSAKKLRSTLFEMALACWVCALAFAWFVLSGFPLFSYRPELPPRMERIFLKSHDALYPYVWRQYIFGAEFSKPSAESKGP